MDSLQKIVLSRLEVEIGKRQLIPAQQASAANVGRIDALDPKTLDSVGYIAYNFQSGYFRLGAGRPTDRLVLGRVDDFRSTIDGRRSNNEVIAWALGKLDDLRRKTS